MDGHPEVQTDCADGFRHDRQHCEDPQAKRHHDLIRSVKPEELDATQSAILEPIYLHIGDRGEALLPEAAQDLLVKFYLVRHVRTGTILLFAWRKVNEEVLYAGWLSMGKTMCRRFPPPALRKEPKLLYRPGFNSQTYSLSTHPPRLSAPVHLIVAFNNLLRDNDPNSTMGEWLANLVFPLNIFMTLDDSNVRDDEDKLIIAELNKTLRDCWSDRKPGMEDLPESRRPSGLFNKLHPADDSMVPKIKPLAWYLDSALVDQGKTSLYMEANLVWNQEELPQEHLSANYDLVAPEIEPEKQKSSNPARKLDTFSDLGVDRADTPQLQKLSSLQPLSETATKSRNEDDSSSTAIADLGTDKRADTAQQKHSSTPQARSEPAGISTTQKISSTPQAAFQPADISNTSDHTSDPTQPQAPGFRMQEPKEDHVDEQKPGQRHESEPDEDSFATEDRDCADSVHEDTEAMRKAAKAKKESDRKKAVKARKKEKDRAEQQAAAEEIYNLLVNNGSRLEGEVAIWTNPNFSNTETRSTEENIVNATPASNSLAPNAAQATAEFNEALSRLEELARRLQEMIEVNQMELLQITGTSGQLGFSKDGSPMWTLEPDCAHWFSGLCMATSPVLQARGMADPWHARFEEARDMMHLFFRFPDLAHMRHDLYTLANKYLFTQGAGPYFYDFDMRGGLQEYYYPT